MSLRPKKGRVAVSILGVKGPTAGSGLSEFYLRQGHDQYGEPKVTSFLLEYLNCIASVVLV